MAFRVRTTTTATHDLDGILGWLVAEGAGDTGLRWFKGLKDAVASLSNFPLRCALAPENASVPLSTERSSRVSIVLQIACIWLSGGLFLTYILLHLSVNIATLRIWCT